MREKSKLETLLNREPRVEEVAQFMNLPYKKVCGFYEISRDLYSLNTSLGEDDDSDELEVFVPSEKDSPEEEVIKESLKEDLESIMDASDLTDREKAVLRMRYNDIKKVKYEDIGARIGVSRERARQIEAKALIKLRKFRKTKSLLEHCDNPEVALSNLNKLNSLAAESSIRYSRFEKELDLIEETRDTISESHEYKGAMLSIYVRLNRYRKKDINHLVENFLNDNDRKILWISYGDDLNHPCRQIGWSIEIDDYLNTVIIPKMEEELKRLKQEKRLKAKKKVDNDSINKESAQVNGLINASIEQVDNTTIINFLRVADMSVLLKILTLEQVNIFCLKYDPISNRTLTTEEIAKRTNISMSEVQRITLEALEACKKNIAFIDNYLYHDQKVLNMK